MPSGSYPLLSDAQSDQTVVAPAEAGGRDTHFSSPRSTVSKLWTSLIHSLRVAQSLKLVSGPLGGGGLWHDTRVTAARVPQSWARIGNSSGGLPWFGSLKTLSSAIGGFQLPANAFHLRRRAAPHVGGVVAANELKRPPRAVASA